LQNAGIRVTEGKASLKGGTSGVLLTRCLLFGMGFPAHKKKGFPNERYTG
jgi:hypothetical protein